LAKAIYEKSVFINCPFDKDFAPLLEAILFCVVYAGLEPRLASERLEAGESRLDKILELIPLCQFSIHDLSRSKAVEKGEYLRMNMPFELGLDMGFRRAPDPVTDGKKFVVFEAEPYELKKSLSDISGTDVQFHSNNFRTIIKKLRDFIRVEIGIALPGETKLETDYYTFLGWMTEKKMSEGHTEDEANSLPTGNGWMKW
jgi:hypothetical protein